MDTDPVPHERNRNTPDAIKETSARGTRKGWKTSAPEAAPAASTEFATIKPISSSADGIGWRTSERERDGDKSGIEKDRWANDLHEPSPITSPAIGAKRGWKSSSDRQLSRRDSSSSSVERKFTKFETGAQSDATEPQTGKIGDGQSRHPSRGDPQGQQRDSDRPSRTRQLLKSEESQKAKKGWKSAKPNHSELQRKGWKAPTTNARGVDDDGLEENGLNKESEHDEPAAAANTDESESVQSTRHPLLDTLPKVNNPRPRPHRSEKVRPMPYRPPNSELIERALSSRKLGIKISGIPPAISAARLAQHFRKYGKVQHCTIEPADTAFSTGEELLANKGVGYVFFRPPPYTDAIFKDLPVLNGYKLIVELDEGQMTTPQSFGRESSCEFSELKMGVMTAPTEFAEEFTAEVKQEGNLKVGGNRSYTVKLALDKRERRIKIYFAHEAERYRLVAPFSALGGNLEISSGKLDKEGRPAEYIVTFALKFPPEAYVQIDSVKPKSHFRWTEDMDWKRLADRCLGSSPLRPRIPWESEADSYPRGYIPWNLGRWFAFRLTRPSWDNDFPGQLRSLISAVEEVRAFESMSKHGLPKGLSFHNEQDDDEFGGSRQSSIPKIDMIPAKKYQARQERLHGVLAKLPFEIVYLVEALITRFIVHEYNFDDEFYETLSGNDVNKVVTALEVMNSDTKRIWNPATTLKGLLSSRKGNMTGGHSNELPKGCVNLPKIIVTPLRVELIPPNLETSNRVVRHFREHGDRFIRLAFREEDMNRLRGTLEGREQLFNRIYRVLVTGIQIGDRHYEFLAFSSSQLRENGCWFFSSTESLTADAVRNWMGDFSSIQSVAKFAARMGQCFSSTRAVTALEVTDLEEIPDIARNGYTFSDGVGVCRPLLAKQVARALDLTSVPSAFQFRLGGCKGVLSVFPFRSRKGPHIQIRIRPSQQKFSSPLHTLEVIKPATRGPCFVNRQIIIILSYLGVPDSVFLRRKDAQIAELDATLVDSQAALRLILQYTNMDDHRHGAARAAIDAIRCRFLERKDPFVLGFLRIFRALQLRALKDKARIYVPKGCFLMGVLDETRTLGENEIFLRYTDPNTGEKCVVTGTCAIARFPSFHPGDIRIVKAVKAPHRDLDDICDVVVFSTRGYRDVPSQCSGGDLDGDEFAVWWDEELLPKNRDEAAMDDQGLKPVMKGDVTLLDIKKFFVNYMREDNLGRIATYHMAHADKGERGIGEGRCIRLAQLHSQAVDFPKSGVPATLDRGLDPDGYPDFMSKGDGRRAYESTKVLGVIYRSVLSLAEDAGVVPSANTPGSHSRTFFIKPDPLLLVPGSESYLEQARIAKDRYDKDVKKMMALYGVQTEIEAVSGLVLEFGKREAGGRPDVELRRILSAQIQMLQIQHRRHFAKEFLESATATTGSPPNRRQTEASMFAPGHTYAGQKKYGAMKTDEDGVPMVQSLHNQKQDPVTAPNGLLANLPQSVHNKVLQKASAWYQVAYDPKEIRKQIEERHKGSCDPVMITFPWVAVGDVLCELTKKAERSARKSETVQANNAQTGTSPPLNATMSAPTGFEKRVGVTAMDIDKGNVIATSATIKTTPAATESISSESSDENQPIVIRSNPRTNIASDLDTLRAKNAAKWGLKEQKKDEEGLELNWTDHGLEVWDDDDEDEPAIDDAKDEKVESVPPTKRPDIHTDTVPTYDIILRKADMPAKELADDSEDSDSSMEFEDDLPEKFKRLGSPSISSLSSLGYRVPVPIPAILNARVPFSELEDAESRQNFNIRRRQNRTKWADDPIDKDDSSSDPEWKEDYPKSSDDEWED